MRSETGYGNKRRRLTMLAAASAAALLVAGCSDDNQFDVSEQIGPNPKLPEPNQYLFPPMHLAPVVGWQDGQKPKVPSGLQISAFATDLQHPRSVYTLPNGDVLIVESKGPGVEPIERPKDLIMGWIESFVTSGGGGQSQGESNRITLVRDSDGDGKPDFRSVFLDHLNSPFGVALVGSDLYVANTDNIMHYTYNEGDTTISDPGTALTPLPGGPIDHHWTKSLVASPDGSKLYVGVGSNSNITENGIEAEKNRAAIWEVDRQTGAHRIFASGLRNPNGLSIQPETGALWAVINERDELGPNLVPDYLTSVKDGGFYGWPYSYFGQHVDPRVMPQRPDLVAKAIKPDYALSSHVAPLGLVFNTGNNLPQEYQGGAFVGEHGSWDRDKFNGYKVVFIPFANGTPNGMAQDVVTGFLNDQEEAQGRPVGVALDKSGALLIADDVGNTVWRVTGTQSATSQAGSPQPDAASGNGTAQGADQGAAAGTPAGQGSESGQAPQPTEPQNGTAGQPDAQSGDSTAQGGDQGAAAGTSTAQGSESRQAPQTTEPQTGSNQQPDATSGNGTTQQDGQGSAPDASAGQGGEGTQPDQAAPAGVAQPAPTQPAPAQ